MPAIKTTVKSTNKRLKAGSNRKNNKWLLIAGVAIIAAVGVLIVRYSRAGGYVWTPTQFTLSHGGSVQSKSNGTTYWKGYSRDQLYVASSVKFVAEYCADGAYLAANSSAQIFDRATSSTGGSVVGYASESTPVKSSGNFTVCITVPAAKSGYTRKILVNATGTVAIYRVYRK